MKLVSLPVMVLFLSLVGCEGKPPKLPPAVKAEVAWEVRDVDSILPGPRPTFIDGARFYRAAELCKVKPSSDQSQRREDRPWVAVEGIVVKSYERLGAPCLVLGCEDSSSSIDCEGDFGGYRFQPGQNVVVIGQLDWLPTLADARLVTQGEIDQALIDEQESK